ncbi:protein of unknown function [Candidatus Promineifilum breve]|uniref:Uncharacterized protein n=1 Tax=Candidatus Promineifilum breve TaxID=1806508 RepID=A0A160T5T6_9CHLR|nr:protein of unknown function [Candidatus Promineifilum breve]
MRSIPPAARLIPPGWAAGLFVVRIRLEPVFYLGVRSLGLRGAGGGFSADPGQLERMGEL